MQTIRNKLKTQKGASITFALLLFLVCAVISSVVIVAATTAAGRMSQLPQMDQRYYAVTSAANLLKSEIDGKTVVVERTKSGESISYTAKYKTDDVTVKTILKDASESLVKRLDEKTTPSPTLPDRTFVLKVDDTESCDIKETVQSNGLLEFEINNKVTIPASNVYTLLIVFAPNIRESATDESSTLTWKFHKMQKIRNVKVVEPGGT